VRIRIPPRPSQFNSGARHGPNVYPFDSGGWRRHIYEGLGSVKEKIKFPITRKRERLAEISGQP